MFLQIKNEPCTTHLISLWCPSMCHNANIPGTLYNLRSTTLIGRFLTSTLSGSTLFTEFLMRFSVVIRRDWDKSNLSIRLYPQLGNLETLFLVTLSSSPSLISEKVSPTDKPNSWKRRLMVLSLTSSTLVIFRTVKLYCK